MRYSGKCGVCGDEFEAEEMAGAAYLVHAARDEFWSRHLHAVEDSEADIERAVQDENYADDDPPEPCDRRRPSVGFVAARYAEGSA